VNRQINEVKPLDFDSQGDERIWLMTLESMKCILNSRSVSDEIAAITTTNRIPAEEIRSCAKLAWDCSINKVIPNRRNYTPHQATLIDPQSADTRTQNVLQEIVQH
jgi:hypothetical protein